MKIQHYLEGLPVNEEEEKEIQELARTESNSISSDVFGNLPFEMQHKANKTFKTFMEGLL